MAINWHCNGGGKEKMSAAAYFDIPAHGLSIGFLKNLDLFWLATNAL